MKKALKLLAIIALVTVIGFSMAACGGGGDDGDGGDNTATYTGTSNGQSYTLKITKDPARYTAQQGDDYELTGAKKSIGKVDSVSGNVLTLKPSNAATTFTATVSGTSLTSLDDTITWTDNTTAAGPGTFTPGSNPGTGGGALSGTYRREVGGGEVTVITFTGSNFNLTASAATGETATLTGTYTVNGNTVTLTVNVSSGFTDAKPGDVLTLTIIDATHLKHPSGAILTKI